MRFLGLVLFIVACDSSVTQVPNDGGQSHDAQTPHDGRVADAGSTMADTGSASRTLSLNIGPLTLAPGEEKTECVTLAIDTEVPFLIREVHARIDGRSHHLIVYRSSATEESTRLSPCSPFTDLFGSEAPIAMVQQREYNVSFPEGVAMVLPTRQLLRLEMHAVNPTSESQQASGTVELIGEDDVGQPRQTADFYFWGTAGIFVPARSSAEATVFTRPPAPDAEHPEPMHFFMMSTHMHKSGVLATVELSTGPGESGELLHQSTNWAEPPQDWLDPFACA